MHVATAVPEEGTVTRPRVDTRVLLVGLGGLLVLVGYLLPFYSQRITRATAEFSDGSAVIQNVDVLITDFKFEQDHPPVDATLVGVQAEVAPVTEHGGSAVAWLAQILGQRDLWGAHASFAVTLLLPLAAAAYMLWFASRAHLRGTVQGWIVPGLNVALIAAASLVLSWPHQFDFSLTLYGQAAGALAPRAGLLTALAGTAVSAAGFWRLRGETSRRIFSWWHLVLAVA
ncbi:MAG: hypothetical protein GX649_13600, partial [Chloroflexi bacterium]|nr:hypothetical protein [Chloroflexota bacterium]